MKHLTVLRSVQMILLPLNIKLGNLKSCHRLNYVTVVLFCSCCKHCVVPFFGFSRFLWTADIHSLLDVAKIADSLVFVLDSAEGWDSYGDYCLSCLFAQGLPSHGG